MTTAREELPDNATEPTAVGIRLDRPVGRLVPMAEEYADRAPVGCRLLHDAETAVVGDLAYRGHIAGRWVLVRRGMNIAGACMEGLWGSGILALARHKTPT